MPMTEPRETPREAKRARTCIGCGERVALGAEIRGPESSGADLVGLVLGPTGELAIDPRERSGRGAHVHARPACVAKAAHRGLAKSFKGRARPIAASELARSIVDALDRRLEGLALSALRTRNVAMGADAVTSACRAGEAALVVVAKDARAGAELTEVRRAIADGRAVAWSTRDRLGALLAPGDAARTIAVLAITSPQIAGAFRTAAIAAAQLDGGPSSDERDDARPALADEHATVSESAAAARVAMERGA